MNIEKYTKENILEDVKRLQYLYKMKEVIRYDLKRDTTDSTESVAEHVYGMNILAQYFLPLEDTQQKLDRARIYEMIAVHDIDEIETGDLLGYTKTDADRARELDAMKHVLKSAPAHMQSSIEALVTEYEARETKEAKFAKAIDKIEPLVQIFNDKGRIILQENKTTAEQSERIKIPYIQDFKYIKKFAEIIHNELIEKEYYWKE